MTSTEMKLGLNSSTRPSSRVLKPPGGGHTNIFGESEVSVNAPRPKYNQQNSSNLNACIGSTDPNHVVEKLRDEKVHVKMTPEKSKRTENNVSKIINNDDNSGNNSSARGRVPPGGYSSGGFW